MKFLLPILSIFAIPFSSGIKAVSALPHMNEYIGSQYQLADGRSCVVFEEIPDFTKLATTIWQTCETTAGGVYNAPKQLLAAETARLTYVQNPRVIHLNGANFLYFNAYDEQKDQGYWGRAEISEQSIGPIEWLKSPVPLLHQFRPWIYPKVLGSGSVLLTYEAYNFMSHENELHIALSSDGVNFSSDQVYQSHAQMTRFEEFIDGTWALAYQVGYGSQMMDYVRISKDNGRTFSPPFAISAQANVHDPTFLKRADGNLDLYYVVWHGSGFGLHRRQINSNGALGAEEKLTDDSLDVQKPSPFRLSDGSILVTFGKVDIGSNGNPTSDLLGLSLHTDAPL